MRVTYTQAVNYRQIASVALSELYFKNGEIMYYRMGPQQKRKIICLRKAKGFTN